jgi:hypothetical protein
MRGGNRKNLCIFIFGFNACSQICRKMIKDLYFISDCYPYLAKLFLWMIATLATNKKILIKTTLGITNLQSKVPMHGPFFKCLEIRERHDVLYFECTYIRTKPFCSHARNSVGTIDKQQLTHMQSTVHPRPCAYCAMSI